MIQITSPVAASAKWLTISGGRMRARSRWRMPPRANQIASITKPPPAVAIQVTSAIQLIAAAARTICSLPLLGDGGSYGRPATMVSLPAPAVGNRRSPVAAERLLPQADAGRRLSALVLGAVDQRDGALDDVGIEAVSAQLLRRPVFLDVGGKHFVERGVGRQGVLVELVLAQLGARGAIDDAVRDQLLLRVFVQVLREPEDVRLENVLQQREAAGHVAVQGRVADGELGLVARRDDEPAEFVRERHQQHAADARLEVLLGEIAPVAREA